MLFILATVRSVQQLMNCTGLEIIGPLKMFMADTKFLEHKKILQKLPNE